MNHALKTLLLASLVLLSPTSWAQDLFLYVFLEERPFAAVEAELDGRSLGQTGSRGEVEVALTAGQHQLRLSKNDATLASYPFSVAAGESAEITISFGDFSQDPDIQFTAFDASSPDSASGEILGQVNDSLGQPIGNALVTIDGRSERASTAEDGSFALSLPRGAYRLTVDHPDFRRISRDGLRVSANVGAAVRIVLPEAAPAGTDFDPALGAGAEEVIVFGSFKPSEDATSLEQFSVAITDAISIDDLLRFGDSDLASALKRIVGVAVTGGKYAVVRGLAGRYVGSTLNGSLMPSTDPFRRDVQLDLFPSEILGSIEIQKSFSADQPGDTTAGVIRMTSRGLPDEDEAGISVSLGYVDGVTGDDLLTYRGGGQDFLGSDDGSRDLPGQVAAILPPGGVGLRRCQGPIVSNCASNEQLIAAASALPVIYNPRNESAGPNFGLSGKYGRRLSQTDGDLGFYGAATYSQSQGSRQDARFENVLGNANGQTRWDSFNVGLNGYFVIGWEDEQGWSVTSKTIALRDTEDRTSIESGLDTTNADVLQVDTTLEWVERQFLGQQIEAALPLFKDHQLSLRAGFAQTRRQSPDRRFYQYRAGTFSPTAFERSYADLVEDSLDFGADYLLPLKPIRGVFTNLRFGVLLNQRDRDSQLLRLGVTAAQGGIDLSQDPESLLVAQNFEDEVFRLRSPTDDNDSYTAVREINAVYVATDTDIGNAWSFGAGVRLEEYSLDLDYPFAAQANDSLVSDRDSTDVLPSLSLTFRPRDDIQIRGGLSRTVSRPDTTELAQPVFYDQEGRPFIGCPSCLDSQIDNVDLRGEYYFSPRQSVSLAVFYKKISDPLEVTITEATNVIRTFDNGRSAEVSGIELDGSWQAIDADAHGLTLSGNLSFIDSEILLGADAARVEAIDRRQLQGQSPFLANIQAAYDHFDLDASLTLVINYFDDRLDSVSRGQASSLIEEGRFDVNLNAEKNFRDGSKVSLRLKNLLDEPVERTQDGRIRETYKTGLSVAVGYSRSF